MFNITVIRIKDMIRYLLTLVIAIAIIYGIKRYFFDKKMFELENINLGEKISNFINSHILDSANVQIPVMEAVNKTKESTKEELVDENFAKQIFTKIIGTELSVVNSLFSSNDKNDGTVIETNDEQTNTKVENNENVDESGTNNIELAKTDVKTEIVTENPLADSYTYKFKSVKIKNETDFELKDEILNPDNLNIDKSKVIIYHTHTCESYTSSEKYSYTPTGNYRTTDKNYSVVRVGDELTNYLQNYGINVIHNNTYHDYPSYTGSYTRSLSTVSKILEDIKADIIIDLHRDAIGSYSTYAPTVKIGDDYCAQLMFVMGTNGGGLNHPNWQNNLKWAVYIQEKANEIYPGLFKPIILRNSRYNQHVGKAACIIEVGATGNTLEQCLNSMKYLSAIINNFRK